jgi:hypothetical protein
LSAIAVSGKESRDNVCLFTGTYSSTSSIEKLTNLERDWYLVVVGRARGS